MITEEKLAELRAEEFISNLPIDEMFATLSALWRVARAAEGLCHGTDWNKGTHAITHGYRQKLIDAVVALREGKETK